MKKGSSINDHLELRQFIGSKLKEARIEKGLSQGELADMLGITHAAVGSYERGRLNISIPLLIQFCDKLDRPISYFIEENKEVVTRYNDEIEAQKNIEPFYNLRENLEYALETSLRHYLMAVNRSKNIEEDVEFLLLYIIKWVSSKS
jgi:HTH-type transcriptional regulator / antitoxin HipB